MKMNVDYTKGVLAFIRVPYRGGRGDDFDDFETNQHRLPTVNSKLRIHDPCCAQGTRTASVANTYATTTCFTPGTAWVHLPV
jgi:hypothetical protein